MNSDPRWNESYHDLVAHIADAHTGRDHADAIADEVLAALADAGLLVEPGSGTRPPLPLDMGTEPCETPMPGRPDLHCDRPLFHAHHGAHGADGTRTLWVDTYTPTADRVEPEVTSRRYEWGERTEDGQVLFTALSGLVDDGWRPLRRYPTARLVRRTRTEYGTVFGPWQPVDVDGGTP